MKTYLAIICTLICAVASADESKAWKLVWADEFNIEGKPNPKNWIYEKGFVRNHELQWYQKDNAFCEKGMLVIEGRRERKVNPNFKKGSKGWQQQRPFAKYTSSCIKTKGLHAWKYGRFEVRAKIIAKPGLWPAIWFLGEQGGWPSNGEIDLMEFYGGNILANACWESRQKHKPTWDESKIPVAKLGKNWDKDFHIWRMDWDKKRIKLYVDNQLLNTIELSETKNEAGRGLDNPFHQPHYILLNLAIGGKAGGDPSKTAFPSRYEIDYVRVYQKIPATKDAATGKLTSPEFTIARKFIRLLIGGGKQAGKTCVNLIIEGKVVQSLVGHDHNTIQEKAFDVSSLQGKKAVIQVVDASTGAWGNIIKGWSSLLGCEIEPRNTRVNDVI